MYDSIALTYSPVSANGQHEKKKKNQHNIPSVFFLNYCCVLLSLLLDMKNVSYINRRIISTVKHQPPYL